MAVTGRVIDFKSVGDRTTDLIADAQPADPTPIGIMTPMRLGTGQGGLFEMYTSLKMTLNDNLKNLLLTDHGERLAFHDFGANLTPLAMDLSAFDPDAFDAEAAIRIKTAVTKYMPFIQLETFESRVDHSDNKSVGKVIIRVNYSIPRLGAKDLAQEVTIFVGG